MRGKILVTPLVKHSKIQEEKVLLSVMEIPGDAEVDGCIWRVLCHGHGTLSWSWSY